MLYLLLDGDVRVGAAAQESGQDGGMGQLDGVDQRREPGLCCETVVNH
jgi:hypothetical protein